MTDEQNQKSSEQEINDKTESREIVKVNAKPIDLVENDKKTGTKKTSTIRINKIGQLTLNIFAQPLKKHYAKHYKENKILLAMDVALVVIVLILLGTLLNIWLFSRASNVHLLDFTVSSNPAKLINGQQTEFTLDYANKTKDTLTDADLVLKIPDSLKNPQYSLNDFNLKTQTLTIGNLAPQAHGQFKVSGLLIGNFGEKQEFLAVINYHNKYGQGRQEFFSQTFEFTDSVIKTQITLPLKIIATSSFSLALNLKNDSALDFNNLKIKMAWPTGFVLIGNDLGEAVADQTWSVGSLKSSQEKNTNFKGKIFNKNLGSQNFQIQTYATYDQKEYLLGQTENSTPLEISKLELSFIGPGQNRSISPGGETTYTLHYKNNETYALENVELGLILNGEYAVPNLIKINQTNHPGLAKINPQAEGTFQVIAKTKSSINFTTYQEQGYQIEAKIIASYDDSMQKNRISIESDPIYTKVDSQLILNTRALFYTPQGDQIGVGTVPPTVGQYTSYWTILQITNTNNQIKNIKVTAKVPAGIEFTNIYNVTDGNQITYDQNTGLIEWQIDSVSASAGIFNPASEARIQLAITPTADQVGKSPLLLTNITATATDSVTGAFLTAVGKNISIAIFPDESLNKVIQ